MNLRSSCVAFLAAACLAVPSKADYLFTYQDTARNTVGFSEPSLQPAGQMSTFLFDKNAVSNFDFSGIAPAVCGGLAALSNGCIGLANSTSIGGGIFPNDSFTTPGVVDGSNGAMVDIVPYSGFLYTYQDANGNILAFSEPTLQSSGNTSQFLFATTGITGFSFNGNAPFCSSVGTPNDIGCTQLNNSISTDVIFPVGSFLAAGTYTSGGATVNIVQATVAPEPPTAVLFPLSLIVGIVIYQWRQRRAFVA